MVHQCQLPRVEVEEQRARLLRQTPLFAMAGAEELDELVGIGDWRTYDRQQVILGSGDTRDHLLVISQGSVRLIRSSYDGREVCLACYQPGEVYGLASFTGQVGYEGRLIAAEDAVVVCSLPATTVQAFLRIHGEAALAAVEILGQRLLAMCDRIEELTLYPVRTRLARELARLSNQHPKGHVLDTHEELASRVGASQVAVTRQLEVLRGEHLIRSTSRCHGIVVLDPDMLAAYGNG